IFSNQSFNLGKEDYVARAKHFQLDGCLVIAGDNIEEAVHELDQSDIPTVAVDLGLTGENSSYVMTDNEKISRQVVEFFYLNGLRKIAFIGGNEDSPISIVRKKSFVQAMKDFGMDLRNEWIKYGNYFEESGYFKMKEMLQEGA